MTACSINSGEKIDIITSTSEVPSTMVANTPLSLLAAYKPMSERQGVEEFLQNNPIDLSFERDSLDSVYFSTLGQSELLQKYLLIWNTELKNALTKLKESMPDKGSTVLEKSQVAWEKFDEAENPLAIDVLNESVGYGSGNPILVSFQELNRIRMRTFQLIEYCLLFDESYSFVFADESEGE
jgi:hypothetical protein